MKQTIGAVARKLGMSAKTLRYYEDVGLVPPPRRESGGWAMPGRRIYAEPDIERLRFIKEARHFDFGIEDIRRLLDGFEAGPPCGCGARPLLKKLVEQKLAAVDDTLAHLQTLRSDLRLLQQRIEPLETKTPAELLREGVPTLSDAVFGPGPSKEEPPG